MDLTSAPDAADTAAQPASEDDAGAPPAIFDVENLNVYYGDFHAVQDVTLPIGKNQITAFIGPSGCGKSTVLRCFNRMNDLIEIARVEGKIDYHGVDLYGLSSRPGRGAPPHRDGVPEAQSLSRSRSTTTCVWAQDRRVQGQHGRAGRGVAPQGGLWDEVKDKLKESALALSGGQQQRLCIARAIATSPDVVLMDEPCSALDPIATLRIEELMQELKADYTISS